MGKSLLPSVVHTKEGKEEERFCGLQGGGKGEASAGVWKGKSLGDDFVKREATLLFLNCELLSPNYELYDGWLGGRL